MDKRTNQNSSKRPRETTRVASSFLLLFFVFFVFLPPSPREPFPSGSLRRLSHGAAVRLGFSRLQLFSDRTQTKLQPSDSGGFFRVSHQSLFFDFQVRNWGQSFGEIFNPPKKKLNRADRWHIARSSGSVVFTSSPFGGGSLEDWQSGEDWWKGTDGDVFGWRAFCFLPLLRRRLMN